MKTLMMLGLILLIGCLNGIATGTRDVYNIAHMTNTPAAVEWAISQGANGVEVDLKFNASTGEPINFYHGAFCDCSCMCPGMNCSKTCPDSVCVILQKDSHLACEAGTPFVQLLSVMARQNQLAVIVIDSKVNAMSPNIMLKAAIKVINGIKTHLFDAGYGGQVVISSANLEAVPYLRSAVESASRSDYSEHVYFATDTVGIVESLTALHQLPTKNIVYGTGHTACLPKPFDTTNLQLAALNTAEGTVGLAYIWSVDKKSAIKQYLPFVSAIMSNYPRTVRDVIQESGLQLAKPLSGIPTVTSKNIITTVQPCECLYQIGGCFIHKPAPVGLACQCIYHSGRTCIEYIVQCKNTRSRYCQHPDTSIESCRQGGGDCGGY